MIKRSVRLRGLGAVALALPLVLAFSAPANAQAIEQAGGMMGSALKQPLRDLNLIRPQTPDILVQAAAAPYDDTGLADCASVFADIAELGVALGPDVNTPRAPGPNGAVVLAAGALGNVVRLPFSAVIGHLSGAYALDNAHQEAILAGMVRRGYLTGVSHAMGCEAKSVTTVATVGP